MQFSAASLPKYGKKDGGEYEPESLAVMQSALDCHLKNAGKKHSILRDREFEKSRQQLEAKARELRVKGYGKRKNASHALNEEDEEFLWQSGQLGKHSAQALVNVNFKNVTEHFGLRGRQEHYSMMVEDFSIIAGLPGTQSARETEPHTHKLWSTSFPMVVT